MITRRRAPPPTIGTGHARTAHRRVGHGPAPILVAIGIGGRLELTAEHIRLVRGGIFGHAFEFLWLGTGVSDKSIPIWEISAVEIVKPILLPDFIRFSYPGSPPESSRYIADALAENALIMNVVDNRAFYAIKEWIDRWPASLATQASEAAIQEDARPDFR
jgi:hypothetical protein